jgi:hypothetical protein
MVVGVQKLGCGLGRKHSGYSGKGFSQSEVWGQASSPLGKVWLPVCLLLGTKVAQVSSAGPSDPPQDTVPFCLLRAQILPSTKLCCLELAPSCVGMQSHSQQPFLSPCSL